MSDIHPDVEAFEFDAEELAERPRTVLALKSGTNWQLMQEAEDIVGILQTYAADDSLVELHSHQAEKGLPPAPVWIRPSEVACLLAVSEERWKVDRFKRHMQELAMKRQGGGAGLAMPGGPI